MEETNSANIIAKFFGTFLASLIIGWALLFVLNAFNIIIPINFLSCLAFGLVLTYIKQI